MNTWMAISILAAATALPAAAASARTAITTSQIAAAINSAGMQISARQVMLLTNVVAASDTPALKVQSMERWGDHQLKVRLGCSSQAECIPFIVGVRDADLKAKQLASSYSDRSSDAHAKRDPKSFVVRSGTPATLLLEGERIHIQLSVVCLESGAPGQTIRVASKDHKQIYTAEIVDGSILKARL